LSWYGDGGGEGTAAAVTVADGTLAAVGGALGAVVGDGAGAGVDGEADAVAVAEGLGLGDAVAVADGLGLGEGVTAVLGFGFGIAFWKPLPAVPRRDATGWLAGSARPKRAGIVNRPPDSVTTIDVATRARRARPRGIECRGRCDGGVSLDAGSFGDDRNTADAFAGSGG
jgi:hypothetical protein